MSPAGSQGPREDSEAVGRLLRAYGLLAGCCDDRRALVGRVSRQWIGAEAEHRLALAALSPAALLTQRGREILADELFDDPDLGPEDVTAGLLPRVYEGPPITINSNRLTKLEPVINAAILTGVILAGVQRYGAGGSGRADIDNDLILAALVQCALNQPDRFSAFEPQQRRRVDAAVLASELGPAVAGQAATLQALRTEFTDCIDRQVPPPQPPAHLANALAAILISELRLSARAAGDQIFRCLSEAQAAELHAAGIETGGEFAEGPWMARDYRRAAAALALPGIDRHALREPLGNTLMAAVEDALTDPARVTRLVGRRGKAVHEVHLNLPLMEYYDAAENPDTLITVHIAALETMRYLDKCRRKSCLTMVGHAFQVTRILQTHLGPALDPSTASAALLHDVAEDGTHSVAGYDQSLHKLRLRFGGPLTAMVSELTDSSSRLDGPRKAHTTCQHASLLTPRRQYDVSRFTEMPLRPTDADTPYTLAGIVIKLADTIATEDEGLRDPDMMSDWWRNSGIRIAWSQAVRGPIVGPLEARLVEEILQARRGSHYRQRETALSPESIDGLQRLVRSALDSHDLYAIQNLWILGGEFGLDRLERERLRAAFFDLAVSTRDFLDDVVGTLLDDARLTLEPDQRCRSTLYRKAEGQPRDPALLLAYRDAALERHRLREQLGVAESDRAAVAGAAEAMLAHYRRLCADG